MKSGVKQITTYKDYCGSFNYIGIDQVTKIYMQFQLYSYPYQKNKYNTGIWKIKWKHQLNG